MKTWKLVSGILNCVLCAFVGLQSCAAGMLDAIEDSGGLGGSAGLLVAIFILVGGIVSIATRNSSGNGGNIALIIIFSLAAILGFSFAGTFKDLNVWSFWCVINAVIALLSIILNKKKAQEA